MTYLEIIICGILFMNMLQMQWKLDSHQKEIRSFIEFIKKITAQEEVEDER